MWCERGHKVRSDLTKLQPLNNVATTLCVSWVLTAYKMYMNHKHEIYNMFNIPSISIDTANVIRSNALI
jgi:hypothetical protein